MRASGDSSSTTPGSAIKERQRGVGEAALMEEAPMGEPSATSWALVLGAACLALIMVISAAVPEPALTRMVAPLVVAKGQDLVAQRIKDLARDNRVPIVENKPLARALYAAVDVGDIVPAELYQAVAEVLAYVYRLKNNRRRRA